MTVAELIKALQAIENQGLRVVTSGYEGGYCDVASKNITHKKINLNRNAQWYYGPHEGTRDDEPYDEIAIYIG